MRTISITSLFGLCFILLITGCKKEDPITYDCTGLTPTYTIDVKPILDANCVSSGCHNSGSKRAGYDLSSYTGARDASAKKSSWEVCSTFPVTPKCREANRNYPWTICEPFPAG